MTRIGVDIGGAFTDFAVWRKEWDSYCGIERSQPPIALPTTQGYRDLPGIARLRLDEPGDLFDRRPAEFRRM